MREGWKEVTLDEISIKIGDGLHGTPRYDDFGEYYFINGNNLQNGRIIINNTTNRINEDEYNKIRKDLNDRTILLQINGTIGNLAIYQGQNIALGKSACYINLVPEVDKYYIRYVLEFDDFQKYALLYATGSTIKNLGLKAVRNYKFILPPLETQKKIASILSGYDDLIENNLKRIKILEEMAQQTYEEWFVRMRFPGYETATINTATGLPEGWEKVKLGDVLTLNYGKALRQENRIQGVYKVYGSSGVVGTHLSYLVEGPSLIVGRKGNVGSVFYEPKPFYPIDTVYFITSDYSLFFLYYTIKGLSFVNNDAAVPGLNRDAAYFKEINLPSLELIDAFHELVSNNYQIIFNLQNQNQRLREAREILLPRLMMGIVEV